MAAMTEAATTIGQIFKGKRGHGQHSQQQHQQAVHSTAVLESDAKCVTTMRTTYIVNLGMNVAVVYISFVKAVGIR